MANLPPKGEAQMADTITSVTFLDDEYATKAVVMVISYRFDQVLDPERLRTSLDRLLDLKGWRRLGARLRINKKGKLELHEPPKYDQEHPSFTWHHVIHDQSIENHPLGARLPPNHTRTARPEVLHEENEFATLFEPSDMPKKLSDWTNSDRPPLAIQVVSFNNATLITTGWSHTTFDAMGHSHFMNAWAAMASGRETKISAFSEFDNEGLEKLTQRTQPQNYILSSKLLAGFSLFLFIIRIIAGMLFYPAKETHMIRVPGSYISEVKAHAIKEQDTFLSDNDVLFAWWSRTIAAALRERDSRPMTLMNLFDFRGKVDEVVFPADKAYVGNAIAISFTVTNIGQLVNESVGATALRIRKSLQSQRTSEQIEAWFATYAKGRAPPLVGFWDSMVIGMSSWQKAQLFEVDFAGAVHDSGSAGDANGQIVKPSYVNVRSYLHNIDVQLSSGMIGRDPAGDWWLVSSLPETVWPRIEEALRSTET